MGAHVSPTRLANIFAEFGKVFDGRQRVDQNHAELDAVIEFADVKEGATTLLQRFAHMAMQPVHKDGIALSQGRWIESETLDRTDRLIGRDKVWISFQIGEQLMGDLIAFLGKVAEKRGPIGIPQQPNF